MTVPTLDQVITYIEILNHIQPGNFNEAKEFLEKLQESSFAWVIADQLLYANRDLYSSYFGAQTMRTKIQLYFEELPVDSHLSLKESLKKHLLAANSNTNSTVSKQLCLALADLFCHMVQWSNSLQEIIHTFSQTADNICMLLDVLKYIPEEFANKTLRLGVNRKTQIFGELEQYRSEVIYVLEQSLTMQTDAIYIGALGCLDAWFMLNIFRDSDLENKSIISLIYQILERPCDYSENLFKAAAKCATDFFCLSIHRIPGLINIFQGRTYMLEQVYRQCENDKIEYCLEYNKIFCEMASALLPYVLESPCSNGDCSIGDIRTLHLLLLTARTSRECCADVLSVLTDVTDHTASSSSEDGRRQLTPLFEDLISMMTHHCAVSDVRDEKSLAEFREDVFYVMEQIRVFVDVESLFIKMLMRLSALLSQQTDGNEAEAVLCLISSLVKFVNTDSPDNAAYTEQLLMGVILPNVAQSPASFQSVSFTLFGELCRWASQRPAIMDRMVGEMAAFIVRTDMDGKDDLQLAALDAALHSLSVFCKRCPSQVLRADQWALMVAVCDRFSRMTFVADGMVPFYESLGRCLSVPSSADSLMQLQQTPAQLAEKLWHLSQLNFQVVDALVNTSTQNRTSKSPGNPCVWMDNVSAILTSMSRLVTPKESLSRDVVDLRGPYVATLYEVFAQLLWPTLARLVDCYIGDGHVLERVVRVLRYGQRCFQTMTKPLLASIAEKIVTAYGHSKESCFLYIGGILVDEFGDDGDCTNGLIHMFHAFSSTALQVLAGDGLDNNPHTTEDLFRLMVRLVQHCSATFLAWQQLQLTELLHMAVRSLSGAKIDAKMLGLRFLVETLSCANQGRVNDVVGHGPMNTTDNGHGPMNMLAHATVNGSNQTDEAIAAVRSRVVAWLLADGLMYLLVATFHLCRWNCDEVLEEELGTDMAEMIINVRKLIEPAQFLTTFDQALHQVGVSRRDGMLYATEAQIAQFRDSLLQDTRALRGLEDFAKLFS